MKILIIGGHGFLGLRLVDDLQELLPCADIYISSSRENVAGDNVVYVNYGNAKLIEELFIHTNPDYIIHLASYCVRDESQESLIKGKVRDNNILGALSVLKTSPRIIFVSSMAVFSMDNNDISHIRYQPESNYGFEKLYMIEKLLNFEVRGKRIDFKVAYPSSIYGKGQTGKMFLPRLLRHIKRRKVMLAFGGNRRRDFIHVNDVSKSLAQLVLNYDQYPKRHIFIHSFILYKISEIADIVCDVCQIDPKKVVYFGDSQEDIEKDNLEFQIVKNDSSQHEFGPRVSIRVGLQEMFEESDNYDVSKS